jgi:hypothetical protein
MPPIGAPKNYAAVRNAAVRRAAKRKPRQSAGIPAASDRPATRAADFRRAAAFKRTPTYHQAVRSAYGNATIRQRQADLVAAAKHRTPEGGDVALVHNRRAQIDANDIAKYGHVIRGANRQEARTLAQLDRRGKIAALKEFGPGTRQIVPEPQLPHFSQAQLAQMRASALPEHHSFLHSLLSKGGGATKSSVLWALKQLSRPGAAIAAGALEGKREEQAPGGFLNTGKVLSAMGQGFTDPYSHMHDWNEYYRRMGVKPKIPNEVLSFATAVGTDPTTYLTAGAGGVAKNAALHTYEDALAKGLSEKEAVAAARKVWAKAPLSERTTGIKLGVRGTPALLLSRGRTSHLVTKPLGTKAAAAAKVAARKAGVSDVRPFGVKTATIRRGLNAVAPSVRPEGWDQIDWALARRAARKARAGEREAQRHAAYRLRAYTKATKGWSEDEHALLRKSIEDGTVDQLPEKLRAVGQQIQREMSVAASQKIERGLMTPAALSGRVGAGAAPQMPQFTQRISRADVTRALREQEAAHREIIAATKNLGVENGRRSALHTMHVGKSPVKSLGQQQAEARLAAAMKRAKDAGVVYRSTKADRQLQNQALKAYGTSLQEWSKAPKGFFPRVPAPEVEAARGGTQFGGPAERIATHSRKNTTAFEFMPPEQAARYESRTPVAVARYLLKHGREINLSRLNERIAALGRDVKVQPEDVADLAGQRRELFVHKPTGLHPLFDKEGKVDSEALAAAVSHGDHIVEVDRRMADAIRSLARGQKDWQGLPPELALTAHAIDDSDRRGIGATYDRMQRVLKTLQTSVNPAYHIVNAIGDSFNAVIGGARPGDFKAAKRLRVIESALKRADLELNPMSTTGKLHAANPLSRATKQILDEARQHVEDYGRNGNLSDLDVVNLGVSHGALRTGLTSSELRSVSRGAALDTAASKTGRVMEGLQNVSDWREDLIRLTTFRGALKRGMSPDEAAEWSAKHHFDYADLSPAEQKFFRRIIPFWTFTARNTPLQVRSLAARPGVYATEEKARAQSSESAGLPANFTEHLREFEQTGMPFGTPFRMALKDTQLGKIAAPIMAYPKLPIMDLANIPFPQYSSEGQFAPGATIRTAGENALSRVTPFAKIPLEQILGVNFFTGQPQDGLVPAPSWMPKSMTKPMLDPRTGKEIRGVSWRVLEPLQATPVTNLAGRQGTTSLHGQPSGNLLKELGWAIGPRLAIQDPRVVKINELYEKRDKLTHEVGQLQSEVVHHQRGDAWGGKVRRKLDAINSINHRIYQLSERMGVARPDGTPPPKGRTRKPKGIGAGFGGGSFGGGFSTGSFH